MAALHASQDIPALTRELIFSLESPTLAPFRLLWPRGAAAEPAMRDEVAASSLPVLRWFPDIARQTQGFAGSLVDALYRAAPSLTWRQTYSAREVAADFMDNYGYADIIRPISPQSGEQIACGFLILGPNLLYPRHRHEAEEVYVPLSGTALWLQGDAIWRERPPGAIVHHAGDEPHAMRTGAQPLLALYLWRSANLEQKARLDSPSTSAPTSAAGDYA